MSNELKMYIKDRLDKIDKIYEDQTAIKIDVATIKVDVAHIKSKDKVRVGFVGTAVSTIFGMLGGSLITYFLKLKG